MPASCGRGGVLAGPRRQLVAACAANQQAYSWADVQAEPGPRGHAGLYVETDASRGKGNPPQLIPAWMFTLAVKDRLM